MLDGRDKGSFAEATGSFPRPATETSRRHLEVSGWFIATVVGVVLWSAIGVLLYIYV